jgi:hypothetical protein
MLGSASPRRIRVLARKEGRDGGGEEKEEGDEKLLPADLALTEEVQRRDGRAAPTPMVVALVGAWRRCIGRGRRIRP